MYSTVFIFGLGILFYFFAIPIEMTIKAQTFYHAEGGILVKMTPNVSQTILFMGLLSLLGFISGLHLSKFVIPNSQNSYHSILLNRHVVCHNKDFQNTLFVIWLLSGLIVLIIYSETLRAMGDYHGAYGQRYSSPLFSYFLGQFYICSSIIAGLALFRKNLRIRALGAFILIPVIILAVYTSDKDPILLALLGIASSQLGGKHLGPIKIICLTLFAISLVTIFLPFFSLFRAGVPISIEVVQLLKELMSFTKIDPGGPMIAISHHITNPVPFRLGATYLTSFGILVPKVLWANRPLDLSEQFAREQIPNWIPGQGLGFSPLAEASLNFGLLGPFIHYLLFAMIWGWGWRLAKRSIFIYKQEQFLVYYQVVGFYALILSFRGPFISSIKLLVIFIVPYFFVFYSIRMIRLSVSKTKMIGNS